ncbi:putative calcium-dependent channel, 7TM region phosphate [Helianthus annuus]|nr:putative calcium-dependent channel, 7TM region phosphate [Helianthus annuus]
MYFQVLTDMYSISHCSFCYVSDKSKVFDDDTIIFDTKLLVFEGFFSISRLEHRSVSRYYLFNFVNVFLGSVIAGTVLEHLDTFLKQSVNKIPETIRVAIPMKATFFITYIMVDGWIGTTGEILRLKPLIIYHLKNFFLVKTEKDREEAMDPGSTGFNTGNLKYSFIF